MTVYLVGAGPGDPDLLTMRAVSLLARADVVVHDRLVDPRALAWAPEGAEKIDVGKRPGSRRNSQDEINWILADCARRHPVVVRLKGGDPFVFGRGGEEAEYLGLQGIDVEVVPGISSAIAGPAAAGIPVTMRGIASGVTIVTAHQDPANDRLLDWGALAVAGTTLVILMGAARAQAISDRLRAGGMAPETPVAVVTRATEVDQQVRRLPLQELGQDPIANPSVIIVGEVAGRDVTEFAALATDQSSQGVSV